MRCVEMVQLRAQDGAVYRFGRVEVAAPVCRDRFEELLGGIHFDSKDAWNLLRSKESTIAPQQLSFCECHGVEKIFSAIPKPRLTRGFSNAG
ncbi:MAG TPA: hypothetical protein VHE09_07485 [Rhizomicrobium sp.]|nr:hypothetical protein [Rhizomicrobium sp.]